MFFEYFRGVARQLALAGRLESCHLCGDIQTANATEKRQMLWFMLLRHSVHHFVDVANMVIISVKYFAMSKSRLLCEKYFFYRFTIIPC